MKNSLYASSLFFGFLFGCWLPVSANGDVIVEWRLTEVTGPTENNTAFDGLSAESFANVAENMSATDLVTASSTGHNGLVWSSGNAGPNKLNLQRWDHPNDNPGSFGNGNGNPNNWLQFSLSANSGYFFNLTSIDFSAWRNGGGAPANWAMQYWDGSEWANFGDVHFESNAGDSTFRSVQFVDNLTATSADIRFVAFGTTGGTGNLHINQMTFNGSVSVIPEPAIGFPLCMIALSYALKRRRSQGLGAAGILAQIK